MGGLGGIVEFLGVKSVYSFGEKFYSKISDLMVLSEYAYNTMNNEKKLNYPDFFTFSFPIDVENGNKAVFDQVNLT